ncbi:MAG: Uma2 family endonuclease [Chloroflexi bacterium]|nr:Uma2 family endonuclease [Chloroflexota bacterium]MCC6892260.1 Uma2 family endonuclease [Anaerolineae bacterium]
MKTITVFEKFCQLPENSERYFELIDGEIVEKLMAYPYYSEKAARISRYILGFVDEHSLGYVTGELAGYRISEQNAFMPDVAFISKERQPEFPETGYNPVPPDLAVEVVSPTDSYKDVAKKVRTYLQNDTRMVLVFEPETETVTVHTLDGQYTLDINDTFDGGDVLPGFKLPLNKIFG